jgi:glycosyltransferase involved in cell wall biosynthesis
MKQSDSIPRLQFISHIPIRPSGGGLYAVTFHTHRQLKRFFDVIDMGPVELLVDPIERFWSRFRRYVLRRPGSFFSLSQRSVDRTASRVRDALQPKVDALFFRSSIHWIGCKPDLPYFVHTDMSFHTYFHNTFQLRDFQGIDLQRIWRQEAEFFENAAAVFFESEWGMKKAIDIYDLKGTHYHVVRNSGVMEPPSGDTYSGGHFRLLTIAKNFHQKGGDLVLDAFLLLKSKFPSLEWFILGGEPDFDWRSVPGVYYEGFLRPDNPEELKRFLEIMGNASLLLHPTREDSNPLVLIEAASFGCPSVTVQDFAIPELVVDGETGVLLSRPMTGVKLAESVEAIICDPEHYARLRLQARERALRLFQWDASGAAMANTIMDFFEAGS